MSYSWLLIRHVAAPSLPLLQWLLSLVSNTPLAECQQWSRVLRTTNNNTTVWKTCDYCRVTAGDGDRQPHKLTGHKQLDFYYNRHSLVEYEAWVSGYNFKRSVRFTFKLGSCHVLTRWLQCSWTYEVEWLCTEWRINTNMFSHHKKICQLHNCENCLRLAVHTSHNIYFISFLSSWY